MVTEEKKLYVKLTPIAAAVSFALLSGCSIIHPLRAPADLPVLPAVFDSSVTPKDGQGACEYAGCMERAIAYGDSWRRHYYDEAAHTQLWRNAMLVPLIPITAISLYRHTYFDNSKKLVGGYAAAGGAMYAMAQYFGLPPQQTTYLTASHTLSCTLLNARSVLVRKSEFDELEALIKKLTGALPDLQQKYGEVVIAVGLVPDKEVAKEIRIKILGPMRKQVAFYENLHARAIGLRNDNRTSGEVLRRKVDLITAETATQLTTNFPAPEKILALIGDFQGAADKIGIGAFPAAVTPPTATANSATSGGTSGNTGAGGIGAGAGTGGAATLDVVPPAFNGISVPLTYQLNSVPGLLSTPDTHAAAKTFSSLVDKKIKLQGLSISDAELTKLAVLATKDIKDPQKSEEFQKKVPEITKKVIVKKRSQVAAKPTPPTVTGTIFDQLLVALKVAKTIELHATSGTVLDFKGTFTRPATPEETDAAKQKEKAANKHSDEIKRAVAKFAHDKAEAAYEEMKKIRIPAENVYHHLRGILATKATVLKDCKPDAEKEPPPFTISPEVTDISLVKDKPTEFTVSNDKKIPKVTISGKNTDKIKHEVKLKGEDFVVVVTATAVIPDGEEAILTVTDFTGKRKFEIKMDASAPK